MLLTQQRVAHAYLDPGSGSMILQLVIGSALGALFMLKVFWGRFKAFVAKLVKRRKAQAGDEGAK